MITSPPASRRHGSARVYATLLPLAVLFGAVAARGAEAAAFLGVALVGALVLLGASMTRHGLLVGRIVLWFGLLLSLGLRPERRAEGEVIATPLTFSNTVPVVVLVVTVAVAMLLCRSRILPLRRLERWLGLFLAVALASSIWSVSPTHSALRALTLIASYLALVVLARAGADDGADALAELNTVVHVVIGLALVGLAVLPTEALSSIPGAIVPVGRLKGALLYVHPNALAFVAVIGIVLLFARVGLGAWRPGVLVRVSLIAVDGAVLVATRTRSALVFLVLAATLGLLLDRRWRRRLVLLVPLAVCAVLVAVQLGGATTLADFVAREQSAEQLTGLTGRTEEWDHALGIAGESPLLGQGYYAGHRLGALADLEGELNTTTDNAWVDVAIDLGIVGLVPLLGFVIAGAMPLVRASRAGDERATTALVVFAVCIGASFVNPSLNESNFWMVVLGFTILAVGPQIHDRAEREPTAQRAEHARRSAATAS